MLGSSRVGEQGIENPRVGGSIPSRATIYQGLQTSLKLPLLKTSGLAKTLMKNDADSDSDESLLNVSIRREFVAYTQLWHISEFLFAQAVHGEDGPGRGSKLNLIASLAFAAFAFEAHLNHIGPIVLGRDEWDLLERKLSPDDKLRLISGRAKISVDRGASIWQDVTTLLKLRNDMAHGKSHIITKELTVRSQDFDMNGFSFLDPPWVEAGGEHSVRRLRASCRDAMQLLHAATCPPDEFFLDFGGQTRRAVNASLG